MLNVPSEFCPYVPVTLVVNVLSAAAAGQVVAGDIAVAIEVDRAGEIFSSTANQHAVPTRQAGAS